VVADQSAIVTLSRGRCQMTDVIGNAKNWHVSNRSFVKEVETGESSLD
ncbi:MAG: hypothetical protein ACI805_002718, partial [Candidatus Azotimanducaceae bacterium]